MRPPVSDACEDMWHRLLLAVGIAVPGMKEVSPPVPVESADADRTGHVDIAVMQSLHWKDDVKDYMSKERHDHPA